MKKEEFLKTLRENLSALPASEVDEILRDQEEFLQDAIASGRTEEEAVTRLGDPKNFAANLVTETKIKSAAAAPSLTGQARQTFGAVVAFLALAPLTFVLLIGPFAILCFLLFAGWATSAGLFLASWALIFAFIVKLLFVPVGFWTHLSAFFLTLGFIGSSFLSLLVMALLTRGFLDGVLAYLKWNVRLIQGQK